MLRNRLNSAVMLMASIMGGWPQASVGAPQKSRRNLPNSIGIDFRRRGGGGTVEHSSRTLDVLIGEAAMASPSTRYDDKPRIAAKRRRLLDRALRRGRRSQIEGALASFTGQHRWKPGT